MMQPNNGSGSNSAATSSRKYYYRRHGREFEICETSTGMAVYPFIRFHSQEEAKNKVYEMNGWKPKTN